MIKKSYISITNRSDHWIAKIAMVMDNQYNMRSIVQQYEYTGNTINHKLLNINESIAHNIV